MDFSFEEEFKITFAFCKVSVNGIDLKLSSVLRQYCNIPSFALLEVAINNRVKMS